MKARIILAVILFLIFSYLFSLFQAAQAVSKKGKKVAVYIKNVHISKWVPVAKKIGFESIDEVEQITQESKRVLLKILSILGVVKISELDEILNESDIWGERVLKHVYKITADEDCRCYAVLYDIITLFSMYAKINLLDKKIIDETKFNEGMKRAINEFNSLK